MKLQKYVKFFNFVTFDRFLYSISDLLFIEEKLNWREPFSHWGPDDWPQYIAWTPTLVLILWQIGHFVKIHKKYCLRFGLVDNTLLGMAKPRMQSWIVSR